jgi:ketosteroid isomerase-like protein
MSSENLDVVRAFGAAVATALEGGEARGPDWARSFTTRFFDPGVEWTPLEEGVVLRGREAVAEWWLERWLASWEEMQIEFRELTPVGEEVIAELYQRGTAKHSGIEVDSHVFMVITLRDGKIARYRGFASRQEAFAAAAESAR